MNVMCYPACIVQEPTGAQGATSVPCWEKTKSFPGRDGKPGADGQPDAQVHDIYHHYSNRLVEN